MIDELEQTAYLKNIARDIQTLKSNLLEVINYMHEAESEVPETAAMQGTVAAQANRTHIIDQVQVQ